MKFGMNLLLWTGELNDGMIPIIKMLKSLGYDGVELPIFNTGLDYARWGKILDDHGLARTAVTIRTADDNPISSDSNIRKKGIEGTMRALDCCSSWLRVIHAWSLAIHPTSARTHFSARRSDWPAVRRSAAASS